MNWEPKIDLEEAVRDRSPGQWGSFGQARYFWDWFLPLPVQQLCMLCTWQS
jgi:hypothetical protein